MEVATNIKRITIQDTAYPVWLREIPDAPQEIYVRGELAEAKIPRIAVVGTRKPTPDGIQTTERLVTAISPHCITISGLAYGVDALAHKVALKSGGITWAVLGTGLDDASIYPPQHLVLAQQIMASGGALISEYPPGTPPMKHHFPMRNRIIAGLSEKVVIIEAPESSGAVITAKLALDYNRDVLAVPGPIFSPNSVGTNRLIAEGAKPVLSASDIIEVTTTVNSEKLTEREAMIYNALVAGARHINEVVQITGLGMAIVSSELTLLEIQGKVRCVGNGTFTVIQ